MPGVILFPRRHLRQRLRQALLLLEAAGWLILVPLGLRLVPFRHLAQILGRAEAEGEITLTRNEQQAVISVSHAVNRSSQALPWQSGCLVRACTGAMMLRRRALPYTLYLGARMTTGGLEAHAWLCSGPVAVSGGHGESEFNVVAAFSG